MPDRPHVFISRGEDKTPAEVLDIHSYEKAMWAILTYGESPSMLYNMDMETRTLYAAALVKGCKANGISSIGIPPLWTGILNDPDLHDTLARKYRKE